MNKLFGTDGIRGKVGNFPIDDLSLQILGATLAQIISAECKNKAEIYIGYDTRESAGNIFQSIATGFGATGGIIYDLGIVSTPLISFISFRQKKYSIAITASHNPFEDNGIKIIGPNGLKTSDKTESILEDAILNQRKYISQKANIAPLIIDYRKQAISLYREQLIKRHFANINLKDISIAIDVANGAGYKIIPAILKDWGASVTIFNDSPNGKNINEKCGALHPEFIRDAIRGKDIQIGACYDGDADRVIFCDNLGNIYDGDMILAILGSYLNKTGKLRNQTIVATIMSNIGLELFLAKQNIKLIRVPVGDKYVLEKMIEIDNNLGGEQSGHIILSDILNTGDGLITTLELLYILKQTNLPLADLCADFKKYPQILLNVKVNSKIPLEEIPELYNEYINIKNKLSTNGRIIIRYSGTEPLLRIMIEGVSFAEIESYAEKIYSLATSLLS